jgi:hypothetical protein
LKEKGNRGNPTKPTPLPFRRRISKGKMIWLEHMMRSLCEF